MSSRISKRFVRLSTSKRSSAICSCSAAVSSLACAIGVSSAATESADGGSGGRVGAGLPTPLARRLRLPLCLTAAAAAILVAATAIAKLSGVGCRWGVCVLESAFTHARARRSARTGIERNCMRTRRFSPAVCPLAGGDSGGGGGFGGLELGGSGLLAARGVAGPVGAAAAARCINRKSLTIFGSIAKILKLAGQLLAACTQSNKGQSAMQRKENHSARTLTCRTAAQVRAAARNMRNGFGTETKFASGTARH